MKKGTKFFVNDNIVHMEGDWTILQACESIHVYIPRFCYSESLSIAGNCRMCLVEIEKSPKLMASCAISIASDMKIHTRTNLALRTRESILEFLLINHPLDCPICDQGGECDLQDQAMIYGSDRGRFHEYKRSIEDKNAGPLIKTIMTRCIHCTRRIRFATEIAGVEAYGCSGRGKKMEVGTYILNLFNSELSGNVIDLCPVGALTSKTYAFTVRPWELKSVETVDIFDCVGTIIRMDVRGSELMRILPQNRWITDKTRFSYDGLKCQRLYFPLIRTTDHATFYTASWKKALTFAANLIANGSASAPPTTKKQTTGVIGQFVDLETISIFKNSLNKLGIAGFCVQEHAATNVDLRANCIPRLSSLEKGEADGGSSAVDLVLLVGANPRFEASSFNVNLRRLVLRGAAAISIGYPTDPTYKKSHFGNGMGLLAKLAAGKGPASLIRNIIFANRPVAVFGFENVRREDSNALAMLLNPVFQLRLRFFFEDVDGDGSIFLNSEGDASRFALRLRHSLRRSFKPKHSLVYEGYVNCESTIPTPVEINILHINASTPGACEVGGIGDIGYVENIRGYPDGPDGLDAPSNCLYLIGADSDKSFVSTENLRTPMCIYQGHHGDIGAKRATVILPSTAYSEKNGTYISLYHRIQQTKAAVQHCGEARDDCKIIQALADILFQPSLSHIVESSSTWPSFFSVPLSVDRVSAREPLSLEATLCSATATLPICDFSPAIDDPYGEAKALSTSSISLAHDVPPENSWSRRRLQHIRNSGFIPPFDNFYLSDVICGASKTMGKCAAHPLVHNFES